MGRWELGRWETERAARRVRQAVGGRLPRLGRRHLPYDRAIYRALAGMRDWRPEDLILDVGANDGRTVIRLRRFLPRTRILAFEPVAGTFTELRDRVGGLEGVVCERLALGAAPGEAHMRVGAVSALNSLHAGFQDGGEIESVRMETLDRVLTARGERRAQLLKIDTEGHDLEVLRGTAESLARGAFDIIQVEAGFDAPGTDQPSLGAITAFLAGHDYHLYGIYNQCRGRALAGRHGPQAPEILVYCDALFVHPRSDLRRLA